MEIRTARQLRLLSKARRLELHLSQQKLADQASVSRKWISEFELGKGDTEVSPLLRLMAALQLRVDLTPSHHHHSGASEPSHNNDLETILSRHSVRGSMND